MTRSLPAAAVAALLLALAPAARATAYTSTSNGNWASAATWGGTGPPGAGDTATINHAVAVTANTTIGDGTASTVLTISGSGTGGALGITGAALTIRGNAVAGTGFYQGAFIGAFAVAPSGSTPGGIILDGNVGVTPIVTLGAEVYVTFSGTSAGHCFARTRSAAKGDGGDSAGNNGYFTDIGVPSSGYWACTYTDFYKLGSSSQAGLIANNLTAEGSQAVRSFTFDHCTFDACGQAPSFVLGGDGTDNCRFTDCAWSNSLADVGTFCFLVQTTGGLAGGTRGLTGCIFYDGCRPLFYTPLGFSLSNCLLFDAMGANAEAVPWASCDGCFFGYATPGAEIDFAGGATNSFFYGVPLLVSSGGSVTFAGNVAENGGSGVVYWLGQTEEPHPSDITLTVKNNITYSSGTGSMLPLSLNSNPALNPYHNYAVIEHNTFVVAAGGSPIAGPNAAGFNSSGCVRSIRSNAFLNKGSSSGTYLFADDSSFGATPLLNELPATAATNNSWKGFATVAGAPFGGVSGDNNIEGGTVYYAPMDGPTAPGAGDLASTDPGFVDPTRTLASWGGTTAGGGVATAAGAMATLRGDMSLVKSSLLPYIRAGYAPTNVALRGASYSGDTSTTDAAGNAWPGGTPGVGAMGYQSAADPVPIINGGLRRRTSTPARSPLPLIRRAPRPDADDPHRPRRRKAA